MKFGLDPPPCVNSAPTDRGSLSFNIWRTGHGETKVFDHVQNHRTVGGLSADSRRIGLTAVRRSVSDRSQMWTEKRTGSYAVDPLDLSRP
jgi:hypothetical protein